MNGNNGWIPEIVYEESSEEGISQNLPLIQVPPGQEMPSFLLIWESVMTGEFEPDDEGNPIPITNLDLVQYANMKTLKKNLSPEDYDTVRKALGLEPLAVATKKGLEISRKIQENSRDIEGINVELPDEESK